MAYKLTTKGEVYALHLIPNTVENAILVYLYEHGKEGPTEIDELVGELHSDESTVLKVINRLLNMENSYIKEV